MQQSDTADASIDSYLPVDGAGGRVELFVRSLAPTTDTSTQIACFDRLKQLDESDAVDSVAVRVWGDGICTHAPEIDGLSEMLDTVTDIYSFSADVQATITPFFRVQRVDSSMSGESFERIVPPHRTLLAYEDDALVGMFPCRIDGETHTPCDAIDRLVSTASAPTFRSADTA